VEDLEALSLHSETDDAEREYIRKGWNDCEKRRVICCTNAVESGITIDVVHVIDTGRVKINKKVGLFGSTLIERYASKASARQREGRVGRKEEGYCWRLYSKER
jgi:HrpA-like RNA helicase